MSVSLPKALLEKYHIFDYDTFVETGTYEGGGVKLALDCGFTDVRSVELDTNYFQSCNKMFEGNDQVKLYLGDTSIMFWEVIKDIAGKTVFWLDAHFQHGIQGKEQVPLLTELGIIAQHPIKDHIIMIDDRRLMGVNFWDKVTEHKVREAILKINPNYVIILEDSPHAEKDIIVAIPSL